jgi:putative membrane protein
VRVVIRALALAVLVSAAPATAHDGEAHAFGWTLSPLVTVPLAVFALLYAVGWFRLRRRSERGRAGLDRSALLFTLGWLSLAGALVSPLHEGGEVSFALHMIEHEIIMLIAALLLVAAGPGAALLWGLPPPLRRPIGGIGQWSLWRTLADPFVATAIQALVIVAWHVPWLFELTLESDGWHVAQHLSFIGSALLFWRSMFNGRAGFLVPALCLFLTAMVGGGLGALMALSDSPWYAGYAALGLTGIGLPPSQDQQLAGLIMWVPGGLWHLAAALWFLVRGLMAQERRHAH